MVKKSAIQSVHRGGRRMPEEVLTKIAPTALVGSAALVGIRLGSRWGPDWGPPWVQIWGPDWVQIGSTLLPVWVRSDAHRSRFRTWAMPGVSVWGSHLMPAALDSIHGRCLLGSSPMPTALDSVHWCLLLPPALGSVHVRCLLGPIRCPLL